MKIPSLLIVVILSFVAGYLSEPKLRMQLTGKTSSSEEAISKPEPKPTPDDEVPFEPVTAPPEDTTMVIPKPPVDGTTPEVVPVVPVDQPVTPTDPVVPEVPVVEVPEPVAGAADVVSLMKASLASREISKFTADQVLEWQPGSAPETIDGVSYQTGTVTYQAETPFGTKNLPAKALIKDGKVVRWISPKSGMQIE